MFDDRAGLAEPKLLALVEMMVLAAVSDGDFGDEEHAKVRTSVTNLTSARFDAPLVDEMIRGVVARAKEGSRQERLAVVREALGTPAACKVALELALGVMLADGVIRTSEREMIADMAEGLGIEGAQAADLVRSLSRG